MDANGSCLQCISIGALQTAGRPTPLPLGAQGLLREPSPPDQAPCEVGSENTSAAVGSLSKPLAEDCGELSREAGNSAQAVGLGTGAQLQLALLLGGLKRRLLAHTRKAEAQAPAASRA